MPQQKFEDNEEIVYSSYLIKKPTVSKSISSTKQLATNWTKWSVKKTKYNHKYWCVLRKTQFSYYKDESERVAEKVIPIQDVLACRSYDDKLDIFTKGTTLRFKSSDVEVIRKWVSAINSLLPHLNNYGSESDLEIVESDDEQMDEEHEREQTHTKSKPKMVSETINSTSDIQSINNGIFDNDKKFFEFYDPSRPAHLIQSGVIYAKNKRSITGKKWKPYKCQLTNKGAKLFSIKSGNLRYTIPTERIIDCIEIDSKEPYFAIVTFNQRLKLRAINDDELVDWIINIKSCVMVRNSLESHSARS